MADSRCFVQFSHPGGEHVPDRGCEKAWHKLKNLHRRKFMRLHGQWIDANANTQAGVLHAWGEWEPESEVVAKLNPPKGDPRHPRYLWRPFYVPKEDYRGLHNTDPFIFGERFLLLELPAEQGRSEAPRPGLGDRVRERQDSQRRTAVDARHRARCQGLRRL